VVTHQLQVERRTAKAHRPKINALPLDHAKVTDVRIYFRQAVVQTKFLQGIAHRVGLIRIMDLIIRGSVVSEDVR